MKRQTVETEGEGKTYTTKPAVGVASLPRIRECEVCGKKVKAQGLGGHMFLEHGVKTGLVAQIEELQDRVKKISSVDGNPDGSTLEDGIDGLTDELAGVQNALVEQDERIKKIEEFIGNLSLKEQGHMFSDSEFILKIKSMEVWDKIAGRKEQVEVEEKQREED